MKFRKKLIIEANQFHPDALPWPKGVMKINNKFYITGSWIPVESGDWIIVCPSITGYRSCNPNIFEAVYEKV